ncbi:hypothetical protein [Desulfosporosinus sp. FKB]|uniref:hypothetical protein n=1 Tax=Desulfosporosinus sp. FKB TaxID=1969835 RepID=UPI001482EBC2|nr:hypothetical protein [Desulfosporosinus sp. FKB]
MPGKNMMGQRTRGLSRGKETGVCNRANPVDQNIDKFMTQKELLQEHKGVF